MGNNYKHVKLQKNTELLSKYKGMIFAQLIIMGYFCS